VRGGGLRGGRFAGSKRGLALHRYALIRGFRVTGLVRPSGKVVLTLPRGKLRFDEDGTVTGRFRGEKIDEQGSLQQQSFAAQLAAGS
jgi:hypothetical protein